MQQRGHDAATHTYRYVTGGNQHLIQFTAWDSAAETCAFTETQHGGTVHNFTWNKATQQFESGTAAYDWKHVNNSTDVFAFQGVFPALAPLGIEDFLARNSAALGGTSWTK